MKKTIGMALAGLVLASGAFAQTPDPFGKFDQPVTVTIGAKIDETGKFAEGDNPENSIYTRYLKEKYNIVVKDAFQASVADYPQKANLAIAANDLPDAMVVNDVQFRQMLKAGQLQDLTDAWNKYASPNLKDCWNKSKGTASDAVVFGGKMMAIPSLIVPDDGYTLAWVRKDWMDKLGMKPPKTVADVEALAKAFVEKNPGNLAKGRTIGIGGPQSGGTLYGDITSPYSTFGFDPIFSAFHSTPGFWVTGKDGKAAYGSVQPETKLALAKLADWYKKGLIDPQMAIRKDATESIVAGQVGLFFGPWWMGYWPFPDALKQTPTANWQAYAVPLDGAGKWTPHTANTISQYIVVRKGFAHPEAVIRIQNAQNRDMSTFDQTKARGENFPLYMNITQADELEVSYALAKDVALGKTTSTAALAQYPAYSWLAKDIQGYQDAKKTPFDKMDIQNWDTSVKAWPRLYSIIVGCGPIFDNGSPVGTQIPFYAMTKTMESKWVSLRKLEDETFISIILGGKPASAFDEFVTKWKAQGGDKITSEVQQELASQ